MLLTPFFATGQRIAVLEFQPGVGVSLADVDGLSSIFVTYFSPEGYTLVERSQIDKIIDEQNFQRSKLTENQMIKIGQLLNLSKVVVGNINIIMGEYNVDVRVINVETGTIAAKDGAAFVQGGYREAMKMLATNLSDKLSDKPSVQNQDSQQHVISKDKIYSDEIINSLLKQPQPLTLPAAYKKKLYFISLDTLEKIDEEEKAYIAKFGELNNENTIRVIDYVLMITGGEDAFGIFTNNAEVGRVYSNFIFNAIRTNPADLNLLPSYIQLQQVIVNLDSINEAISSLGGQPLTSAYWTKENDKSGTSSDNYYNRVLVRINGQNDYRTQGVSEDDFNTTAFIRPFVTFNWIQNNIINNL